ncbi:radical SAM protein [Fervidobacterium thailandense]|uniref:Radical SAM protein n=1 Tax=Fervidobacterium thailandense TaxID=1008305 RepID=A0A1E3G2N8_9BACT|nr:radical SAM protein [Fervidobacterium thailandense]ODN30546.1 radical SAM protein [Fervidobacterium thailandense]
MRQRPKNIEYEITTACNYTCAHCYCNAGKKSRVELSTEEIKSVIDQLVEAEAEILDIVGGEPMLRPDLLDILAYGKAKGLQMMMNTNASLATKEYVSKIKEVIPELLIGVSLDGPVAEIHEAVRGKGTFERTYRGIMNFLEAGFDVTLLFVVNKINYSYIEDMLSLAKELGTGLYVDRFIPVGRGWLNREKLLPSREMVEFVARKLEEYQVNGGTVTLYIEENILGEECTAGKTHASILVDGNVVPCGHFRYNPEFFMGNVKNERFKEIWERFNSESLLPLKCQQCSLRNVSCMSGCLAQAYFDEKKVDSLVCKLV